MGFVHLHCHTMFSIMDGLSKPSEIASKVKSLKQDAVALTDHGTMSATVDFYNECKKNGVKPIIGCEMYFVPDPELKDRGTHLILLAKNNIGYHNLLKLVSISSEHRYYKPRLPLSALEQYHEGLICLSACMASIINTDNGEQWAKKFKDIFGVNFYLEIQSNSLPEQIVYNNKVIDIADRLNIELVVTTDAHYPSKEDAEVHRRWVFVNKKEQEDYYTTQDFYIQSEEEIRGYLGDYIKDNILSRAIENTGKIAQLCNVQIEVEGNHYPLFNVKDPEKETRRICNEGWLKKIVPNIPKDRWKEYIDRTNEEISILNKCGYLNYLLITRDILNWCYDNGILTGIGRGSSAGSLVCYLMDITKIDPIPNKLLFGRFVNPERLTPPDVDNDVESNYRDNVIEYIKQKYGYVYNIRTFNYLGIKNAIRRAGQTLGKSSTEINEASKGQDSWDFVKIDEQWLNLAKRFEGLIDSFGCHASAVLIFPNDPSNYCSVEIQGDKFVASYDYHDLEEFGLLKLDLLGLKNLDVISSTLKMIDEKINIYNLPLDDKKVYELYSKGELSSVFQCESDGMMSLAKRTNVSCFEDVVALMALYRPGPLHSGLVDRYIENKTTGKFEYPHPSLEPILNNTSGIMCIDEDSLVMTKNNQIKIKQIKIGDEVLTHDGSFKKVTNVINNGIKETITIRGTLGEPLSCTKDHKILTNEGWKEAGKLKIGDLIKSYPVAVKKENIGDDRDWLVGLCLANADLVASTVVIACRDKEFAEKVKAIAENSFRLENVRVFFNTRCWYVSMGSRGVTNRGYLNEFNQLLRNLGLKGKDCFSKFLPGNYSLSTLTGVIEGDGCMINKRLRLSNHRLAHEVYVGLQSYGIQSSFYIDKDNVANVRFCDIDGIMPLRIKEYGTSALESVYLPRNIAKKICINMKYKRSNLSKENYIALKNMMRNKNCQYIRGSSAKKLEIYNMFNHYNWSLILDIKDSGYRNVYDLSVEENHSFVANGLVVHNCYQEQTMEIVGYLAGMTLGEQDYFRRVIGRKELDKIDGAVTDFKQRAIKNGYPEEVVNEIGEQIRACGNYQFNKSHAAAYGYTSYVTAYLKTHFPLEYMCSVLNNEVGDLTKVAEYINECKRMNIEVLPPDINNSGQWFTVESNGIRFGLASIKNCGSVVEEIIQKRPFDSIDDMLEKCSSKVNKRVIESLLKAGTFSNIDNRPLGYLLAYLANAKETVKKRKLAIEDIIPMEVDDAQAELEVLGLFLSKDPFANHKKYLKPPYCSSYQDFQNLQVKEGKYGRKQSEPIVVGGLVVGISDKDKKAKNGTVFGFIDIEFIDGGKMSLIAFSDIWQSIKNDVTLNSVVRIKAVKSGEDKGQVLQIHVL